MTGHNYLFELFLFRFNLLHVYEETNVGILVSMFLCLFVITVSDILSSFELMESTESHFFGT